MGTGGSRALTVDDMPAWTFRPQRTNTRSNMQKKQRDIYHSHVQITRRQERSSATTLDASAAPNTRFLQDLSLKPPSWYDCHIILCSPCFVCPVRVFLNFETVCVCMGVWVCSCNHRMNIYHMHALCLWCACALVLLAQVFNEVTDWRRCLTRSRRSWIPCI